MLVIKPAVHVSFNEYGDCFHIILCIQLKQFHHINAVWDGGMDVAGIEPRDYHCGHRYTEALDSSFRSTRPYVT
jgi:hypothetical protein